MTDNLISHVGVYVPLFESGWRLVAAQPMEQQWKRCHVSSKLSHINDRLTLCACPWKSENIGHSVVSDPLQSHGLSPGSLVHGILQARILEWVAIPFSRESSQPRDWTQVSCIKPRSPALKEDYLSSEPSGKPHYILMKTKLYGEATCVCSGQQSQSPKLTSQHQPPDMWMNGLQMVQNPGLRVFQLEIRYDGAKISCSHWCYLNSWLIETMR